MLYQLSSDIQQRIQTRLQNATNTNRDDILRRALDALDWQDGERVAIQEGIDDMEAGNMRPLREFDEEFRAKKNISLV